MKLSQRVREIERLAARRVAASEARRALPAGSSRARVTTANARHASACEAFDRAIRDIANALGATGAAHLERAVVADAEKARATT